MRVQFVVPKGNGPERLLCEAEVLFEEEGPLAGMKLVGFSLWKGPDGDVYVTFPARSFGMGSERKFFDYLRSIAASGEEVRRVKAWILEAYRSSARAA